MEEEQEERRIEVHSAPSQSYPIMYPNQHIDVHSLKARKPLADAITKILVGVTSPKHMETMGMNIPAGKAQHEAGGVIHHISPGISPYHLSYDTTAVDVTLRNQVS